MTLGGWEGSSCRRTTAVKIANVDAYATGAPRPQSSPIDGYYGVATSIVQVATPSLLATHPSMGALLMVGLVSATENYFRDILANIIAWCPIARDASSQEKIGLGTVLWHGGRLVERGVFEHVSFTSSDNVKSTIRKFVGHEVKRNGALDSALEEYDKICELRHGVVHSGGVIAGKNALSLALRSASPDSTIRVGFAELQDAADVCTTVVAAANAELFVEIVTRWATRWRRHRSWNSNKEAAVFSRVWKAFYSQTDRTLSLTATPLSLRSCKGLVRKQYKL